MVYRKYVQKKVHSNTVPVCHSTTRSNFSASSNWAFMVAAHSSSSYTWKIGTERTTLYPIKKNHTIYTHSKTATVEQSY